MRQSRGIPQPSFLFTQSPITLWCEVKGRSRWPRRPGGPGGKNQKSMLSLITPFKINLGKGTLSATHVESATLSIEYCILKCCVAASLTTMQTTLQSIQGFSNWMKNAHFDFFQLKIPLSKPPSCCCPCNGTRSTRLEKVAKFKCIHQGGRILRHLHGLLLLPVMQSMITSGETLCCDNRRLIGTPLIVIARQSQKNRD